MYLGNDYFFAALGGSHEIVYQNITLSGKETAEEIWKHLFLQVLLEGQKCPSEFNCPCAIWR